VDSLVAETDITTHEGLGAGRPRPAGSPFLTLA